MNALGLRRVVLTSFVVLLLRPARAQQYHAEDSGAFDASSCTYKASEGVQIDLSGIRREDLDYTGTTNSGYTYHFNLCRNTIKVCNQQPAPASKWRGSKCNNLGESQTQTVRPLDLLDPSKGLMVSFKDGDTCKQQVGDQMAMSSRTVDYELHCDPSVKETAKLRKINEISMCEYSIVFASRHACPVRSSSNWLTNFLVFVLVLILLYLGLGFAFNYKQYGMRGTEAIPHYETWQQVPGLVKSGVQYISDRGMGAGSYMRR